MSHTGDLAEIRQLRDQLQRADAALVTEQAARQTAQRLQNANAHAAVAVGEKLAALVAAAELVADLTQTLQAESGAVIREVAVDEDVVALAAARIGVPEALAALRGAIAAARGAP